MTDARAVAKLTILALPFLAGLGALVAIAHAGPRPERTFHTDEVSAEVQVALIAEYERFVGRTMSEYGTRWSLNRPIDLDIVPLRDQASFERYARAATLETLDRNGGIYLPDLNTIAFPAYTGSAERVLRHELVHVLLQESGRDLPPWVDEGLASTLEDGAAPARPEDADLVAAVMDPPRIRWALALEQAAFSGRDNHAAYEGCRLWITFLLLESPAAFDEFLRQLLVEGADAGTALTATFGDLDRLQDQFGNFLRGDDGT